MKTMIAVSFGLTVAVLLTAAPANADGQRKGKRQLKAEGGEPAANVNDGKKMRNFGGKMGQAAVGNGAQLAQMMIAQFDQNGDSALDAAELSVAMTAFMQTMQAQMQQRFGMAAGSGQPMGQAAGNNMLGKQHQFQHRSGRRGGGGGGGAGGGGGGGNGGAGGRGGGR
jgi:hypothetical protein